MRARRGIGDSQNGIQRRALSGPGCLLFSDLTASRAQFCLVAQRQVDDFGTPCSGMHNPVSNSVWEDPNTPPV